MITILVVEDDQELNNIICRTYESAGYDTVGCLNVDQAYQRIELSPVDLIVTDIMMPEIDGYEFAESIRLSDKRIPILFITARSDFESKQRGFSLGIDDYMVKPIDMKEMVLRTQALLRRANIMEDKKITFGEVVLDEEEMSAYVNGIEVELTVKEFQILYKLLSYPRRTFTRNQLLESTIGNEGEASPRIIDVYITKLRNKFSDCKEFEIVTVHGLGYKGVINEKK